MITIITEKGGTCLLTERVEKVTALCKQEPQTSSKKEVGKRMRS